MRKTNVNNKTHKKVIRILKKYMTKKELQDIQNYADLWEIFQEALEEK